MRYGLCFIGILLICLIAYAIGRRIGIKEGYLKGIAYAPLKMKEEAYASKKCPLCSKQN